MNTAVDLPHYEIGPTGRVRKIQPAHARTNARASKPRFSRAHVAAVIERRIHALQKQHRFDPDNGWAQVEGAPIETIVDYGAYDALLSLLETLGLEDVR